MFSYYLKRSFFSREYYAALYGNAKLSLLFEFNFKIYHYMYLLSRDLKNMDPYYFANNHFTDSSFNQHHAR